MTRRSSSFRRPDDFGVLREVDQRPGQRQGCCFVARDQDRDERVAHLLVVQGRAVVVGRREQVVEHVVA